MEKFPKKNLTQHDKKDLKNNAEQNVENSQVPNIRTEIKSL